MTNEIYNEDEVTTTPTDQPAETPSNEGEMPAEGDAPAAPATDQPATGTDGQ